MNELALLGNGKSNPKRVVKSFMDTVNEVGMMREVLRQGKLAVVLDDCLFVHGAVSRASLPQSDVQSWAEQLNLWVSDQVREWENQPMWDSQRQLRGGEGLIQYAVSHPFTQPLQPNNIFSLSFVQLLNLSVFILLTSALCSYHPG